MTKLVNNPAVFTEEMLEGFCKLYPQYVRQVAGGVVRSTPKKQKKVAVVIGGGSGHYPAFCGTVGHGFADGAVVGNIFTSPSAEDAYNVGKAADCGGGILFITGNYAGDVINFNQAQAQLISEGYAVKNLYVTDDVASAKQEEVQKRRGIAGDFIIFKIAGAAAERGSDLDYVEAISIRANSLTRTLGVGFDGCTLPGAAEPLFTVPKGKMGLGLGIHGEPGISEDELPTAHELAKILVNGTLKELSQIPIKKIGVILNGLGTTKYEELFVLWRSISSLLTERGYQIVEPEVGELVTSLDMAGCSLSIILLDPELEYLWRDRCATPAYKKGALSSDESTLHDYILDTVSVDDPQKEQKNFTSSSNSHVLATEALNILKAVSQSIIDAEEELGRIDAIAGDGDHGRGMVKGITAAVAATELVVTRNCGISTFFIEAGKTWASKAGGTSGALWGNCLKKIGEALNDDALKLDDQEILKAVNSGISAVKELGKAEIGDKTMLDAMIPFLESLMNEFDSGNSLISSWGAATKIADQAAKSTAKLSPKIGRARPLAEKSIGSVDAGATSFALIVSSINIELQRRGNQ
jgi:dihydroxyacetone kinase